jgi:hypothetical protein
MVFTVSVERDTGQPAAPYEAGDGLGRVRRVVTSRIFWVHWRGCFQF